MNQTTEKTLRQENLSVLTIYRRTFRLLLKNPLQLILLNLPMAIVVLIYEFSTLTINQEDVIYTTLASFSYDITQALFDSQSTLGEIVPLAIVTMFLMIGILFLLYILSLGIMASNIATMIGSSDWILGRYTTTWRVYRRVLTRYFIKSHFELVRYIYIRTIAFMIVMYILLNWAPLILTTLFFLWLVMWLSFDYFLPSFLFAVIIGVEKKPFISAYGRSHDLVFGYEGKMFATIGIVSLLFGILTYVLSINLDIINIGINWSHRFIFYIFSIPILQLMTAVIYYELRKAKEGYDEKLLSIDLGYAPIMEHINL